MTKEQTSMSQREADWLGVIQSVSSKQLKQAEAARQMGLSVCQIKGLVRQPRADGAADLKPAPDHFWRRSTPLPNTQHAKKVFLNHAKDFRGAIQW